MKRPLDGKPKFDPVLAASYIGKYVLIGITYVDADGKPLEQEQMHGIITAATEAGITVELKGGEGGKVWNMPPDHRAISPAKPGTYTLRDTGEEIEDPDLLATWTINRQH